jgi:uncharacterized protein (DUF2132 family)
MEKQNSKDPLHGITLKSIVKNSWIIIDTLGELVKIKCFNDNPSIKSSLTFLRKTDWARKQVEELYVQSVSKLESKRGFN